MPMYKTRAEHYTYSIDEAIDAISKGDIENGLIRLHMAQWSLYDLEREAEKYTN